MCALCLDPAQAPLTTPCGHTFCSGRAGECGGLRAMAELNAHAPKCPQCRADILGLLVEHFPQQIHSAHAGGATASWASWADEHDSDQYSDDDMDVDEYDEYVQNEYDSGQYGWLRDSAPRSQPAFGHSSAAVPPCDHCTLHERFHPVFGAWQAELRPGGAFYAAALGQIRWRTHGLAAALVDSEQYAFLYEDIMREQLPVPCHVTTWSRSDGKSQMFFVYDRSADCLVYWRSDCYIYTGPALRPYCDHAYGAARVW